MPALLVAQTKVGFQFPMSYFDFPALPGPEQELVDREGQGPGSGVIQQRVDQKREWLTTGALVALTAQ